MEKITIELTREQANRFDKVYQRLSWKEDEPLTKDEILECRTLFAIISYKCDI